MSYQQPTSYEEYIVAYEANVKFSGKGLETATHFPCPFCAAPDNLIAPVMAAEQHLRRGAECKECGRGWKATFTGKAPNVSFEIVQTSGPEQPAWLPPGIIRARLQVRA